MSFYYNIVWMHKTLSFCAGGNHFKFEDQRKVILNETHETYISQFQIMQKPKIVQLFVGKKKKICGFGGHFLFC